MVCTSKGGKQTISTTFTGDFQTRYHAILKTTFDPPIGAISHMGANFDGKYLGPDCPAGDAPEEKNKATRPERRRAAEGEAAGLASGLFRLAPKRVVYSAA